MDWSHRLACRQTCYTFSWLVVDAGWCLSWASVPGVLWSSSLCKPWEQRCQVVSASVSSCSVWVPSLTSLQWTISSKMKQTLPCQVAFCGGVCHRALRASAMTDLTNCASGFSLLSRCLKEELAYSLSIFLVTFESGFSQDWQSLEGRIGP